nr:hypothetical protein [Pedobacter sp. ASV2]
MKRKILTLFLLLTTLIALGQQKIENTFITTDNFKKHLGDEMAISGAAFSRMSKSGLKDNCLSKMDFTFVSDKKENLLKLGDFIKTHYPYSITKVKKNGKIWELNGETNEIPVTADNLLCWCLDMYKRGYEFDSKLEAYGGLFDHKNQKFLELDESKEDYYFDKGLECYNRGDLSGSIFNWSLTIAINPKEVNAYYSRAIVRNELYLWKAAQEDYNKAIEIAPDFASALINRGALKDENRDYQGAIADYEKVLKFGNLELEDKQSVYFNLGNTKLNLKDNNGACENWKKALELGADYAKSRIDKYCK